MKLNFNKQRDTKQIVYCKKLINVGSKHILKLSGLNLVNGAP